MFFCSRVTNPESLTLFDYIPEQAPEGKEIRNSVDLGDLLIEKSEKWKVKSEKVKSEMRTEKRH